MILQNVAAPHDDAIGRRAPDGKRPIVDLSHTQRFTQRQRMARAGVVHLRGDHPDIVGQRLGDPRQNRQTVGINAVVVRDKDAHAVSLQVDF
jgi:hypothetical protein